MKEQKKSKKKKVREIQLPMKFNVGLEKFELDLPLRKTGKKFKLKTNWILFLILLIVILSIGYVIIISLINYK